MRYLLFGVWLALLLAAGLAFVHEQLTLEEYRLIVPTMYGEILCHIDALQMLDMADRGYSVTWYGDYVFDDTPVWHAISCTDAITITGPVVLTGVSTPSGPRCFERDATQNVQVNNGVMIQVNQ